MQLSDKEDELKTVSESLVDFENLINRFQAVANGDMEENKKIAKETNRAPKKKDFEGSCKAVTCVATPHDYHPLWVCCDTCNRWFHTLCEGFTAAEELALRENDEYSCLACEKGISSTGDVIDDIANKAAMCLDAEEQVQVDVTKLQGKCDKLKQEMESAMGPRERDLSAYLDKIRGQVYNADLADHTDFADLQGNGPRSAF